MSPAKAFELSFIFVMPRKFARRGNGSAGVPSGKTTSAVEFGSMPMMVCAVVAATLTVNVMPTTSLIKANFPVVALNDNVASFARTEFAFKLKAAAYVFAS